MPELPDVNLYVSALNRLIAGEQLTKVIIKSPFLLRTFEPPIEMINGLTVTRFSRLEKKIVWHFENQLCLVFHLMITGRFHWRKSGRMPSQRNDLAAFQFEQGTMMLTEAGKKKRAALYLVGSVDEIEKYRRGGLEIFEISLEQFSDAIKKQNRTLKRALTDPTVISGIGNAYSDEILHTAKLSPLQRTKNLSSKTVTNLYKTAREVLSVWMERLSSQAGDKFPEKVTAFRPEMAVHGKFGEPCPVCAAKVQRIRYADNECNYCPRCQTDGKLLADRSLSRLLKDDWPKTIDEME